jgi:hypothetical protein
MQAERLVLRRHMFGRNIEIETAGQAVGQTLLAELALYPAARSGEPADLLIRCAPLTAPELPACPRQHGEVEHGFVVRRGNSAACFQRLPGRTPEVTLDLRLERGALNRWRQKFSSRQFSSRAESAGQVFHELALLPALHLFDDLVPLHASTFVLPSGEVVAVGGTGGVGKTSLELELCRHRQCAFMADDISVLDQTGMIWPNFNFPKIYAYNVVNDVELERKLIPKENVASRLQWAYKKRRGGERVRRRISPEVLYGRVAEGPARLGRYWLLVPATVSALTVETISAETATEMTLSVLSTEFGLFHSHLDFHEFNCLARKAPTLLTRGAVLSNWRRQLLSRLSQVECALLRIPQKMDHAAFKAQAADLVTAAR